MSPQCDAGPVAKLLPTVMVSIPKNRRKSNTGGGIEPTRGYPQRILSPQRLPFRHAGKRAPIDPSESARHKHTEVRLHEAIRARPQGPTTDVERSIGPDGAAERRFRSCVDVRSRLLPAMKRPQSGDHSSRAVLDTNRRENHRGRWVPKSRRPTRRANSCHRFRDVPHPS